MTFRSPFRWWLAAVAFGGGCVLAGWAIAGLLGLYSPIAACVVSVLVVFLGGGGFGASKLGGASLFGAVIGFVATIGLAIEGHKALFLRRVPIVEAPSAEAWPEGADAVRVPPLVHERALAFSKTWKTTGKNSSLQTMVVTPLVAWPGGPVVAFHCRDTRGYDDPDGGYLVRASKLETMADDYCDVPLPDALAALEKAGRTVAPGAAERVVRVFTSEERMRGAADLEAAFRVPLILLGLYVVGTAFYARKAV